VFLHRHGDPVSRPHVVQEKIRVGIKDFCAECFGNRKGASIDLRAHGRSGQCAHVTDGTANLVEQFVEDLLTASLTKCRDDAFFEINPDKR
jgi:hypothetical protein